MKRKSWTVTPIFLVLVVAILGMAIFSFRWNIYIFIAEMFVALISIVIAIIGITGFQGYVGKVVKRAAKGLDKENLSYMESFPIPIVITGEKEDVVWFNTKFKNLICNGRDATGDFIKQYIPNTTVQRIVESGSADVIYADRRYTVLGCDISGTTLLYFIDDTYYKETAQEYVKSRPVVATIVFDNYAEFESEVNDEENAYVQLSVDNTLQKWAVKYSGLYKKLKGGRYLVLLEERALETLVEEKFTILQEIKNIKQAESVKREPTISIGIGRSGSSFKECDLWSRSALEMALGRGGDQVAIKTKENFQFFGGVLGSVAKVDKVRTRVIAASLTEHIKTSDHVLIMGHKNSDLDCVGSAIGLWSSITKDLEKPAHVVVCKKQSLAKSLIDATIDGGNGNMFMEPNEALSSFTDRTLLIVVDTHIPTILEEPKLYEKCKRVVVIDHHRMMVNHISNSLVFFHEPYASSTAEMATELIQYMGDKGLTRLEADALLAGITLDTKNFVLKTGVRTFEAAAYLRKKGADTVKVKKMFSNSLDTYKAKYELVSQSEIIHNCAIACAKEDSKDIRLSAAQAADELLSIHSVQASFVMYKYDGAVNISARSLGAVNVQIIMEALGGGGHQTMAGAQIKDVTIEQMRGTLVDVIKNLVNEAQGGYNDISKKAGLLQEPVNEGK